MRKYSRAIVVGLLSLTVLALAVEQFTHQPGLVYLAHRLAYRVKVGQPALSGGEVPPVPSTVPLPGPRPGTAPMDGSAPPPSPALVTGPADARHLVTPKLPRQPQMDAEFVTIEGKVPGLGLYSGPKARAPIPPTTENPLHFKARVSDVLAHLAQIEQSKLVPSHGKSTTRWTEGEGAQLLKSEAGRYVAALTAAQRRCTAPKVKPGDTLLVVPPQSETSVQLPLNFPGDHQLIGWRHVRVDAPGKSVVLVVSDSESTAWRVEATPGTVLRSVWATGLALQAVLGVPADRVSYSAGDAGCAYPGQRPLATFVSEKLGVPSSSIGMLQTSTSTPAPPTTTGPTLMAFVDPSAPAAGRIGMAALEALGYVDGSVALMLTPYQRDYVMPYLDQMVVLNKPFVWPPGLGGAYSMLLLTKPGQQLPSGHPWHSWAITYE